LAFIWGAAIALLLGLRFEMDYRYWFGSLPPLVDQHGNTASVETAMAGLDSYARAKQIRKYGLVSFGVGVGFCACAAVTKNQRNELRAV